MRRASPLSRHVRGFTLVELLVVIGIIALLVGILFPTIRKMRIASQEADSRNMLNQLDQACQNYFQTENGYPGPFPNAMLDAPQQNLYGGTPAMVQIYDINTSGNGAGPTLINDNPATLATVQTGATTFGAITTGNGGGRITGAENLVLGLCGGLAMDRAMANRLYLDPTAIGQGPISLNPAKVGRTSAYIETSNLSKGKFADESGIVTGVDSIIPEFQDRFATPMPILYMRSTRQGTSTATGSQYLVSSGTLPGDYNIVQIQPYTSYPTGGTKAHGLKKADPSKSIYKNISSSSGATYQGPPYDAYDYLVEPTSYDPAKTTFTATDFAAKRTRKKDSYILISAGRDRIYGTEDDITNFGSVLP